MRFWKRIAMCCVIDLGLYALAGRLPLPWAFLCYVILASVVGTLVFGLWRKSDTR